MAQSLVPSGGGGGTLVITVNASQAISNLNVLQARIISMVGNTQSSMSRMTRSFSSFNSMLAKATAAIAGFLAIRQLTRAIGGFVDRMIDVNRTMVGFIASMSVIKGSARGAADEYQFLVNLSKRMGLALENSIPQYHRLAAAMKNVDTTGEMTRNIFSGISQAAAVLQSRGRDVTLIFEAIQQMASKGRLSLEELQRQLGNTLPGAISISARAMMASTSFMEKGIKTVGAAEQELRQQISDGTINVYEYLVRFSNQLKLEYGTGVAFAVTQFTAAFNNMKTAIFEFFRVVGDSGAMAALTRLARTIAGLFDVGGAAGAQAVGKILGEMIDGITAWVAKLDNTDVNEFFVSVQTAMANTAILVGEFLNAFREIGGPETQTPLLDFVEFTSKAMAILVDVFRTSINTILLIFNSLENAWLQTQGFIYGGSITDAWVNKIDQVGNKMGVQVPGRDSRDQYREERARIKGAKYDNDVQYTNLLDRAGNPFESYNKVDANMAATRQRLQYKNSGIDPWKMTSQDFTKPPPVPEQKPFTGFGSLNYKGGQLPDFLSNKRTNPVDKYVDPLSLESIQDQVDDMTARGIVAPGSKGKDKKGKGKTKADPSGDAYMRETTRLVKDLAVAQNELDNVMSNKNKTEGKAVAQMRALISTDERYIGMTEQAKAALMAKASALDEVNRKIEEAIKLQEYHNDTLQEEYDSQNKIIELMSSGSESRYRNQSDLQNSFKTGGENEQLSLEAQRKMIADSIRRDDASRLLDMARITAMTKQQNADLEFQASLYGKSTIEVQKMTAQRQIDLQIQQMMVGATVEMQAEYVKLGEVLKGSIGDTIDSIAAKQQDMFAGMNAGIQSYMDAISDRAGDMNKATVNALSGMEDAFVSFAETGKLSFKDMAASLVKDILRVIVRMLILWMLQRMTGMGGEGGGAEAGSAGEMNAYNSWFASLGGSANGNAFSNGRMTNFANGGIFSNAMSFPMRGGNRGTLGEAGPEAVMPLARTSSGQLGIQVASSNSDSGESVLNLSVEVYQGEGSGVKTEKSKGENGDILKIFIGEVAADVKKGGPVGQAITQVYGVKRTPKSYA